MKNVFENYKLFFGFKLFILAHTFIGIYHRWALEFVGSPALPPKISEFWFPIARIQQARFWQNRPKFSLCQNLAASPDFGRSDFKLEIFAGFRHTRFWPNWQESDQCGRIPAKLGKISVKLARIWLDSGFTSQISASLTRISFTGIWRRRLDVAGFHFTPLVIFSYEPNIKKYFQKKKKNSKKKFL